MVSQPTLEEILAKRIRVKKGCADVESWLGNQELQQAIAEACAKKTTEGFDSADLITVCKTSKRPVKTKNWRGGRRYATEEVMTTKPLAAWRFCWYANVHINAGEMHYIGGNLVLGCDGKLYQPSDYWSRVDLGFEPKFYRRPYLDSFDPGLHWEVVDVDSYHLIFQDAITIALGRL